MTNEHDYQPGDRAQLIDAVSHPFSEGAIVEYVEEGALPGAPFFRLLFGHSESGRDMEPVYVNYRLRKLPAQGPTTDEVEVDFRFPSGFLTDFRDGNWHPWTGGECPVEAMDEVEYIMRLGSGSGSKGKAGVHCWKHGNVPSDIIAFRVTQRAPDERELLIDAARGEAMCYIGMPLPKSVESAIIRLYDAGYLGWPED